MSSGRRSAPLGLLPTISHCTCEERRRSAAPVVPTLPTHPANQGSLPNRPNGSSLLFRLGNCDLWNVFMCVCLLSLRARRSPPLEATEVALSPHLTCRPHFGCLLNASCGLPPAKISPSVLLFSYWFVIQVVCIVVSSCPSLALLCLDRFWAIYSDGWVRMAKRSAS